MKLAPLRNLTLTRLARRDTFWVGVWVITVVALEVAGRSSPHEFSDAVGVGTLGALVLFTWREHRRQPFAWIAALEPLTARARRLGAALSVRTGLDLRHTPPLPRGIPAAYALGLLALALLDTALASRADQLPADLRALGLGLSATLTFAAQGVLWAVLIVGAISGLAPPCVLARSALLQSSRGTPLERRQRAALLVGVYILTVGAFVLLLPPEVPWVLVALSFGALAALLPFARRARLTLVWKARAGPLCTMNWTTQVALQAAAFAGIAFAVLMLTQGARFFGAAPVPVALPSPALFGAVPIPAPTSTVPFTTALGTGFGWGAAGIAGLLFFDLARLTWVARRRDPAPVRPPRVCVSGAGLAGIRERVGALLRRAGFEVTFVPGSATPTDVHVRLGEREGLHAARAWPLLADEVELAEPRVQELLRRRSRDLCRRRLVKGLESLFQAMGKREDGMGTWVAPHLWFETRLNRDTEEDDDVLSNPAYHPTIPLAARSHFAEVLRGAALDLIFVEDGVSFPRFERVLGALFAHHDRFGGARAAEESGFAGLPGVRVVVHEQELGGALRRTGYPEPGYEDVGRARILHVFRDRGGDAVLDSVPSDDRGVPLPAALG